MNNEAAAHFESVDHDPFADVPLSRVVPTTEAQREVWLADQLSREASLAYNESISLRLRGPVDVPRLSAALQALIDRHDALRATISPNGQDFCIASQLALDVRVTDHSRLAAAARENEQRLALRQAVEDKFDLEHGPLVRARILQFARDDVLLILTAHHIVCDGWSFGVLVNDLGPLYAQQGGHAGTPLPSAASFADFAIEQLTQADRPEHAADEAYWLSRFSGSAPVLDLPTDRPRKAQRSFASRREDFTLDADLVASTRKLGAQQGASLFSTLVAGFAATLHRVCGSGDLVIGVPAAGQSAPGFAGVVGHCVNLLPLRVAIDANAPLTQAVAAAQTTMLDAFEHQQYTFGTLLKKLVLERDPSRLPLVSVMFNLDQALDANAAGFAGLEVGFAGNPRRFENFELFINAVQEHGGLRLECQYNADLFDAATVRRWLGCYATLLRAACAAPTLPLHALAFASESDQQQLRQWNATAAPFRHTSLVHTLIEEQAERTPERIALRFSTETISYAQLDARANQMAHALRSRGVRSGALVGLHIERNTDMLAAMLGVLKAGGAYVPLDPAYPADRLIHMASDARLAALVTTNALTTVLDWPREHSLRLDGDASELSAQPATALPSDGDSAQAEMPAYVIYTSGSTGLPKGVQVPHRAVVNFLQAMAREPGLGAQDCLVAVTTLSFDIAVTELLLPLTLGAQIVLASREEAGDALLLRGLIDTHRASVMQATPATWRLLLDSGWHGRAGFKALCGGEPLSLDLAQRLAACTDALWNMYGPTETTVWSTCCRIEPDAGLISIGRPIANTSVWVLDEHLQLCPIGVPGEICIGGDGVTLGYLHRPELTAERFIADPFSAAPGAQLYRTGDRGRWRDDGALEHLGRLDFQVKLRGYRIELGEIEATLLAHADVARAVAITREDRPGDVRLIAYVVAQPAKTLSDAALKAHLKRTLPDYMVPQHLIVLPAIPLLPNGKVDRKALPAPEANVPVARSHGAPRSASEKITVAAMETALGLPGLSVDDSFFALGGHSLLAAQLAMNLGRATGLKVPLRTIFDAPTAAQLAAWIDAQAVHSSGQFAPIQVHAEQSTAPASLMQQRVWFLEQFEPGRLTYNTPSAHRLKGPLDVAALERSFNEIIRRQAILRTAFAEEDGVPVQRIAPVLQVSLTPVDDLSRLPPSEREPALMALLQQRVAQLIDLRQAPLFKVGLVKLADQEHVLFFMPHHIIWDGWSFDLFYEEMAALYGAFSQGREPALAPLAVSYGDFSHWQQQWLQGEQLQSELAYWKSTLQDLPDPLELPLDHPRPAHMSGAGSTQWISCSSERTQAARRFGQSVDATLFMTLLAAYAALLSRITGQTDIVIGTPVRGRHSSEVENIMGFFVNALPLRIRIDLQKPFVDLLAHVRDVVLNSFSYPDVPFERLVRELHVPRDESRTPIYQTFFSFQDTRQRTRRWGNLQQEQVHLFQPGAAEDLGLWFLEHADGLAGGLTYNTDVFSGESVRCLVNRFHLLLDGALASPNKPVALLPITPDEERLALQRWNQTAADPIAALNVAQCIQAQAQRTPNRIAVSSSESAHNYAELESRSNQLARLLRSRGAGRGAMVGLCVARSSDMLVALLAILKSGAAYVPLDPSFPSDRLTHMVEDAELNLLVTHSTLTETRSWAGTNAVRVDTDAALIDAQSDAPLAPDAERDARPQDPAYVIYTSGSTGKPKGVMVPHAAVLNFLGSMARTPGLGSTDRLLAVTTLSFDMSVLELLLPLSVGAQVIMASGEETKDGPALRSLIESSGATAIQATPSTWHMLLDAGWQGSKDIKALIGGEPLPQKLARQLLKRSGELWNVYGPTETTVWSTCWKVEHPERGIFIGRPIDNTQVHILDDRRQLVPIGVPGEICIGGHGVTLGYLKRPELTADRFVDDPFSSVPGAKLYRTGDRGRWRHDGLLEHLGRLDFQVKVRGFRIELGEIEANLLTHPEVARTVVIVREDRPGDVRLVAYIVPNAAMPSTGELREHLRKNLPDYMLPQHYVPLERMPLLPNGKINRHALLPPSEATAAHTEAFEAPSTDTERAIAEVWQELLGISEVSVNYNFFDLGGHSLLAMRLVAKIEKRLACKLPLTALMAAPTVRELAAFVQAPQTRDSVVLIRAGGPKPPLFFVHDGFGETLLYRTLAHHLRGDRAVYGLQPYAANGYPMLHTRIGEMAAHHVAKIRQIQRRGPYHLSGLCTGGVIAFEIARQLQQQGESIGMVALLEAAEVNAPSKVAGAVNKRLKKFTSGFKNEQSLPLLSFLLRSVARVGKKIAGFLTYELRTFYVNQSVIFRAWLLRRFLDRRAAPPQFLQNLSAGQILYFAQRDYALDKPLQGQISLFRATQGTGDLADEPSIEQYHDPLFGWAPHVTGEILAFDVPGGHSSMLQEPNVPVLAEQMQTVLDGFDVPESGRAQTGRNAAAVA